MKIVWKAVFAALALVAIVAVSCGKSDDDDNSDDVPVGALELTCGGATCIGTEAE